MPHYHAVIHTSARDELNQLPTDDRNRLTTTIHTVAHQRQPTSHPDAKILEGQDDLFRVRVGDVRAICTLDKPALKVLRVGHRANVYEIIDTIEERREPAV